MLIERYKVKLEKIGRIYKIFYKFRFLFAFILIFIVALTSTLLGIKGYIINTVKITDINYGEKLNYEAKGLFSNYISYEFKAENNNEWSKEEPYKVGNYEIRGISKNIFGGFTYGESTKFKINPLNVDVKILENSSSIYGEIPILDFGLINGDRLIELDFSYESFNNNLANVKMDESSIKIIDINNEDVTDCYNFNFESSYEISLLPRKITFEAKESIEYDALKHKFNNIDLIDGSLYNLDRYEIDDSNEFIDAKDYKNSLKINFFDNKNRDVSNFYSYSFNDDSHLEITKRNIIIKTSDFTKIYDGKASENNTSLSVIEGSLANGDKIESTLPLHIDAGTYKNQPTITIRNSKGEVVNKNYNIKIEAGNYIISPRPLKITFRFSDKTYDGDYYNNVENIYDEGILDGHYISVHVNQNMMHVGTHSYDFEVNVYDDNTYEEVTKNYSITVSCNNYEVYKRKITIQTISWDTGYTGKPQGFPMYKVSSGTLAATDSLELVSYRKETNIGTYENEVILKIIHRDAGDVTFDYDIAYDYGTFSILEKVDNNGGNDDDLDDSDWEGFLDTDYDSGDGGYPSYSTEIINSNDSLEYGGGGNNFNQNLNEVVLKYTPTKSGSSFFKSSSFGRYNGKSFEEAPLYQPKYGVNPQEFISILLEQQSGIELAGSLNYYKVASRTSDLVPLYPKLNKKQQYDAYSVISDLKTKDIFVEGYDFDYLKNHSLIDNATFNDENVRLEEENYRAFVDENYRGIEGKTFDLLKDFIKEKNLASFDTITLANKLMNLFKNEYFYSTKNLTAGNSSNPMIAFLTQTKIGKCDYFAGAASLIFRMNGKPSRVIGGYLINGETVGKTYDVIAFQKHAITEVYIEGKGWVGFDFTVAPLLDGEEIPPIDGNDEDGSATGGTSLEEGGDSGNQGSGGGSGENQPKEIISLYTDSATFEYDGKEHSYEKYSMDGNLKDGDQLFINTWSKISKAGSIKNDIQLEIRNKENKPSFNNYTIRKYLGDLTIQKRDIYLTTEDITISFSDLKSYVTTLSIENLISGDYIYRGIQQTANIKKQGVYKNIFTVQKIINDKGEDVTNCYNIHYIYGKLTVI